MKKKRNKTKQNKTKNTITKIDLGRKTYFEYTFISQFIIWWSQGRNPKAEAGAEVMVDALRACPSCFIIVPMTDRPGAQPPTMGWARSQQSLIKEMPYRLAYSLILWRDFHNYGFLLSDDSRLCQVDIKLTSAVRENKTPHKKSKFKQNESIIQPIRRC